MKILCRTDRLRRTLNAVGFGILLLAPLSLQAEMLGYDYVDIYGKKNNSEPGGIYANPKGEITFHLRAGVDRKVEVEIASPEGQVYSNKRSELLGANDRVEYQGRSYYGAALKLRAPSDGDYLAISRIISSSGEVVSEDRYRLVVARNPPSTGQFEIDQSRAVFWSGYEKPLLSGPRLQGVYLRGIESNIPLSHVNFTLLKPNGEVVKTFRSNISGNEAGISRTEFLVENTQADRTLKAEVVDAAGNFSVNEMELLYDYSDGKSEVGNSETIAIYDPSRFKGQEIPGIGVVNGYIPYTPGITISENPIRLIFRVPKENYHEFSPYGIGIIGNSLPHIGNSIVAEDKNNVYVHSQNNWTSTSYGLDNVSYRGYDRALNYHANTVSWNLDDKAIVGPKKQQYAVKYSDSDSWIRGHRNFGLHDKTINLVGARVIVESRPFRQKVRFRLTGTSSNLTKDVILQPGETVATVDFNYNKYDDMVNNGGSISSAVYFQVFGLDQASGLSSQAGRHYWMEGDYTPPEILSINSNADDGSLIVETLESDRERVESHIRWRNYYVDFSSSLLRLQDENGKWHSLSRSQEIELSHWRRDFVYSTKNIPEGVYIAAKAEVVDIHKNQSNMKQTMEIIVDRTKPEIAFESPEEVKTLDDIVIVVNDNLDSLPVITDTVIQGGPANDKIGLATVRENNSNNRFRLEYPIMFPTLTSGEEYLLTIHAKDVNENNTDNTFKFVYDPPRVDLAYGDGFVAMLPAISQPFYRPSGARIIESKPLQLRDGSLVVGRYQLIATLRSDAEVPLMINGQRLNPGDTVVLDEQYDFAANDSQISVSAYPAEDGVIGTSSLLLSTSAPNAPVLLTNITTWLPDIALTADSWEVKQLVDLVDIRAERNGETTCRVTMDVEEAKTADPIADPVCLMEWTQKPIETEVVAAGSGEAHISKLFGNAITLGEQDVAYELFLFSATGEKMKVGEGSRPLTVVDASDSIDAEVVPRLEETYRFIRPVSGMVRETSRSRCSFFTDAKTARDYGATIPYDSPQLACHMGLTALPDGVEERPGSRPAFSGSVSALGEAGISWDIKAFSRTGVEVLVGRDTHTFDVIEPPIPEIDFITDNAQRRAFENEDREPGVPEDELVTVPYAANYLGKAFYRSGPGALSVAVRETGAKTPMVEDRFGVPMANRDRLVMSRVKAEESYPLFSTIPLTIEAGYTDHPTLMAERQVEALVVPGERVQPYLYVESEDRTVLNTDTTTLRVEIGDPRFDGPYTAERFGEWEVRIVNELRRDEFVLLSDFKDATNGTASFDVTLDPQERNNVRLLAEARLKSPVDGYQRTEFSSSPVYVTVLEGNPLNAEIETRTLSGPAPYRGIFQLGFDTTDELRASGDIEWRVRKQGDAWDIDQRSADDRQRLRKTTHFETPGTYEVEARVTNRNSGATSLTQKARIIVYDVPTLTLEGPRTAFIGDEVSLKATVEDDDGSEVPVDDLTVEWSTDLGRTWAPGPMDYHVTRDEKDSVIVWVRVKPESAPVDDRYAWEQDNAGVSFREVKNPSFYVQGPRQVEAGKPYEFSVTKRPPYIGFNRELEGYFTLPDGTLLEEGSEFTYTPTEEDLADGILPIRYTGWVEGYREQTTTDDVLEARVWEYTWPVWGMYVADNASVAPAEVLLRVRKITRSNRLEGLTYEWELDPGLQIESAYSDLMRKVIVPEPGTYSYKVTISDARGYETVLEGELTYGEPEPYVIEQRRYYSNRYMRNPLQVSVSPRVDGGHPRDFVRQFEFEVNGEPVTDASRNARLTLDEGVHEILVRMTSDYGKVIESVETVEVIQNQPPNCDMRVSETSTSWRYRAECRDPDGRVHDYEWTINGELSGLGGYGLAVSKGQYETKPHVVLRGKDDSGDFSEPVSK